MSQTIKLIVVDLDGTLLNSKNTMTERVETTLKKAIEQGVQVVIATGKTRFSANDVVERLGLTTPGIYLQGLTIYQADGTISYQKTLDPSIARQVITFAEDRGFDVVAYSGSRLLTRHVFPKAQELADKYHEPEPEGIGPLQNIVDEMPVNKLIAVKQGDPRRIKALRWQLEMQLGGNARLMQAMIDDMVEILPPKASKGVALEVLLKQLGVSAQQTLAIGDGENDIEMIKLAGIGVAIGNADEQLKAVADHVVSSNDQDGVAEAIEKFVLVKPEPETESATETSADKADDGVGDANETGDKGDA